MALSIKDGNAAAKSLKSTLDGSDHVTHVNVDNLPASPATSTLQTSGNASLTAIAAALASALTINLPSDAATATKQDLAKGVLDNILTALSAVVVNPGSTMAYGNGTCNGSAQQLTVASTVPKNGIVYISAKSTNSEDLTIADASAASDVGVYVAPGAIAPITTDNVNKLYARGATSDKWSWYCNK